MSGARNSGRLAALKGSSPQAIDAPETPAEGAAAPEAETQDSPVEKGQQS